MDSIAPLSAPFRLRDRLVTPQRNSISGPDGETGVEPKIMAVLCVLAAEPGRVFTRAELIDRVWRTEFGADESLTRAVSHLRKALGDTWSEPLVIETISKRGYRLLPQALSPEPPVENRPAASPPVVSSRRNLMMGAGAVSAIILVGLLIWLQPFHRDDGISVTVLPVNALSREPSEMNLAAALTVDLVGALTKERRLHVTVRRPGPKSSGEGRRYYTYIDLQTEAGQIKANAEIMDIDNDQALWSQLYEQPFDSKLSSQDALAGAIAKDMIPKLLVLAGKTQ